MTSWRRDKAQRAAFAAVDATCPAVKEARKRGEDAAVDALHDAFESFERSVKDQTGGLRSALVDAHERILELEEEVEDLKAQLRQAEAAHNA